MVVQVFTGAHKYCNRDVLIQEELDDGQVGDYCLFFEVLFALPFVDQRVKVHSVEEAEVLAGNLSG